MREILFRGKVKYNGLYLFAKDWVEGSLIVKSTGLYFIYVIEEDEFGNIIREFEVEVIPETIGQFTGLTDKTGTKIFEDDIIEVLEDENKKTDNNPCYFNYGDIGEVIFEQRYCAFNLYNREQEDGENMGNLIRDDAFNFCKVIGNIHDNPELLIEL